MMLLVRRAHGVGDLVSVPVRSSADPQVRRKLKDRSNGRQGMVLVIEELVGRLSDVIRGDSINAGCNLSSGHAAAVCEHLSADIIADAGEVVRLHEDIGLQLVLGTSDLFVSHLINQRSTLWRFKS